MHSPCYVPIAIYSFQEHAASQKPLRPSITQLTEQNFKFQFRVCETWILDHKLIEFHFPKTE